MITPQSVERVQQRALANDGVPGGERCSFVGQYFGRDLHPLPRNAILPEMLPAFYR